jgi:flagellar basal-body rod protein FlgB
MAHFTEAVTTALLKLALDGAALRHQAIAANIANATTPGYQPVRVSFESQLEQLRQRLDAGEPLQRAGADAAPQVEAMGEAGDRVAIDLQAAELAQNVVHYQALVRGLNKRMSILATAINEGKR